MGFIRRTLEYAVGRSLSEAINHTVKKAISKDHPYASPYAQNRNEISPITEPTKICPSCETPSPQSLKFCPNCGTKLPEPIRPAGFFCSACGKQNAPGAKFCTGCGAKLSPPAIVEPNNETTTSDEPVSQESSNENEF